MSSRSFKYRRLPLFPPPKNPETSKFGASPCQLSRGQSPTTAETEISAEILPFEFGCEEARRKKKKLKKTSAQKLWLETILETKCLAEITLK